MSKTQEQIARKWAENHIAINGFTDNPVLEAVAEVVLRNTKPETMRDVEWDPEKHRGLGATDDHGDEWVMLEWNGAERIVCATPDLEKVHNIDRLNLIQNGKRYGFTAEEEAGHDVLETTEDYEGAPLGTVVLLDDNYPLVKSGPGWLGPNSTIRHSDDLGGVERRVARLGWES